MDIHKGIYYGPNPYAQGEGQYQDLLGMNNEPAIIYIYIYIHPISSVMLIHLMKPVHVSIAG